MKWFSAFKKNRVTASQSQVQNIYNRRLPCDSCVRAIDSRAYERESVYIRGEVTKAHTRINFRRGACMHAYVCKRRRRRRRLNEEQGLAQKREKQPGSPGNSRSIDRAHAALDFTRVCSMHVHRRERPHVRSACKWRCASAGFRWQCSARLRDSEKSRGGWGGCAGEWEKMRKGAQRVGEKCRYLGSGIKRVRSRQGKICIVETQLVEFRLVLQVK